MCGVVGILSFRSRSIDAELESMANALAHRGPDQQHTYVLKAPSHILGLGHRRLAIRDLTDAGRQPIFSQNRQTILTYNGEIYNDQYLSRRLYDAHGVKLRTHCDAEPLVEILANEGVEAIGKLNGIFAFAAYNIEKAELILARDPLGVKPLYLYKSPDGSLIAFASEVKSFLGLSGFSHEISVPALAALLTQGYVGPKRSLMRDVTSVSPGQVLRISKDGTIREDYIYRPRLHSVAPQKLNSPKESARFLRPLFEHAVRNQSVSDAPLAVWQSGGVDSSLISAATSTPKLPSFVFSTKADGYDEVADAKLAADHVASPLTIISTAEPRVTPEELFSKIVWHLDGEIADSSALAVYQLAEATIPHARVVLSGDGADEVFGGYATYNATRISAALGSYFPGIATQNMSKLLFWLSASSRQRYPKLDWAGRFFQGLQEGVNGHAHWRRYAMPWQISKLFRQEQLDEIGNGLQDYYSAISSAKETFAGADPALLGQYADIEHYLPGDMLIKVDRMSMAHGLEVRVPFLDGELLAQIAKTPVDHRLPANSTTKPILRELMREYGFNERLVSRRKTGFNIPLSQMIRENYRALLVDLLCKRDLLEPYLNQEYVIQLCDEHLQKKANHAYLLWSIMTFAEWRSLLGH